MQSITRAFLWLSLFVVACMAGSCKRQGCTDPEAINYDITADEDDGSCIVCQINTIKLDSAWLPLVDKKSTSQYYNDTVGWYYFDQYLDIPSDKVCGRQQSDVYARVVSSVPENMYYDFDVSTFSGPVYINFGQSIYLEGYSQHEFGIVRSIYYPPFYKIGLDSLKLTLTGYIAYY